MPLNVPATGSSSVPLNAYLDQKQTERIQHEHISRANTPTHRPNESRSRRDSGASSENGLSNPLNAKDVIPTQNEKHRRALAMKMDVPDKIGTRSYAAGQNLSVMGRERRIGGDQERLQSRTPRIDAQQSHPTIFDDTTTDFDNESSVQDNENITMVYRGDPTQRSRKRSDVVHYEHPYQSTFDATPLLSSLDINIPPDWQEQVHTERMLQEEEEGLSHGRERAHLAQTVREVDRSGQAGNRHDPAIVDTPSRTQNTSPVRFAPQTKVVSFESPDVKSRVVEKEDSPELEIPRNQSTIKQISSAQKSRQSRNKGSLTRISQSANAEQDTNKMPFSRSLPALQKPDRLSKQPPQIGTFASSRTSDYPTSSEDEIPPMQSIAPAPSLDTEDLQSSRKRRREDEIDYDVSVLKTLKYKDLLRQGFGTDPRRPSQDTSFDSRGNPVTLSQRLVNLGKMSEEEQKTMFRSQGDEEWSKMGSWFIERFQEDLKRLMDVRLERRKISMRYEDEIRRRQKDIEWCSEGVEEELRDLKKGGGDLIKGRDASSRRGTPQKQ